MQHFSLMLIVQMYIFVSVGIIIIIATVASHQPESDPARWNSTQTNDTEDLGKASIGHAPTKNDHGVDKSGKIKKRW